MDFGDFCKLPKRKQKNNIDKRLKFRFNVQPWVEIYLIYFNLFSLFDPCFYKFSISKIESVELKFPFNQKHFTQGYKDSYSIFFNNLRIRLRLHFQRKYLS